MVRSLEGISGATGRDVFRTSPSSCIAFVGLVHAKNRRARVDGTPIVLLIQSNGVYTAKVFKKLKPEAELFAVFPPNNLVINSKIHIRL